MLITLLAFFLGAAAACVLCVIDPDLPVRWWGAASKKVTGWLDR